MRAKVSDPLCLFIVVEDGPGSLPTIIHMTHRLTKRISNIPFLSETQQDAVLDEATERRIRYTHVDQRGFNSIQLKECEIYGLGLDRISEFVLPPAHVPKWRPDISKIQLWFRDHEGRTDVEQLLSTITNTSRLAPVESDSTDSSAITPLTEETDTPNKEFSCFGELASLNNVGEDRIRGLIRAHEEEWVARNNDQRSTSIISCPPVYSLILQLRQTATQATSARPLPSDSVSSLDLVSSSNTVYESNKQSDVSIPIQQSQKTNTAMVSTYPAQQRSGFLTQSSNTLGSFRSRTSARRLQRSGLQSNSSSFGNLNAGITPDISYAQQQLNARSDMFLPGSHSTLEIPTFQQQVVIGQEQPSITSLIEHREPRVSPRRAFRIPMHLPNSQSMSTMPLTPKSLRTSFSLTDVMDPYKNYTQAIHQLRSCHDYRDHTNGNATLNIQGVSVQFEPAADNLGMTSSEVTRSTWRMGIGLVVESPVNDDIDDVLNAFKEYLCGLEKGEYCLRGTDEASPGLLHRILTQDDPKLFGLKDPFNKFLEEFLSLYCEPESLMELISTSTVAKPQSSS